MMIVMVVVMVVMVFKSFSSFAVTLMNTDYETVKLLPHLVNVNHIHLDVHYAELRPLKFQVCIINVFC
jgi:hypothetical protein